MGSIRFWTQSVHTQSVLLQSLAGLTLGLLCLVWGALNRPFQIEWGDTKQITNSQAQSIFEALHQNMYRSFDYPSDTQIYDALAQTLQGPLLNQTFKTIYESLILKEEGGGAKARISMVRPLDWKRIEWSSRKVRRLIRKVYKKEGVPFPEDLELSKSNSFIVESRWRVTGDVSHWGHQHRRVNEYQA